MLFKVDTSTMAVLKRWLMDHGITVSKKRKAELVQDVYDALYINHNL